MTAGSPVASTAVASAIGAATRDAKRVTVLVGVVLSGSVQGFRAEGFQGVDLRKKSGGLQG